MQQPGGLFCIRGMHNMGRETIRPVPRWCSVIINMAAVRSTDNVNCGNLAADFFLFFALPHSHSYRHEYMTLIRYTSLAVSFPVSPWLSFLPGHFSSPSIVHFFLHAVNCLPVFSISYFSFILVFFFRLIVCLQTYPAKGVKALIHAYSDLLIVIRCPEYQRQVNLYFIFIKLIDSEDGV
jgi:hypothetical protein